MHTHDGPGVRAESRVGIESRAARPSLMIPMLSEAGPGQRRAGHQAVGERSVSVCAGYRLAVLVLIATSMAVLSSLTMASTTPTVEAQNPRPDPRAVLDLLATRYMVPLPERPADTNVRIGVSNAGWEATDVAVAVLTDGQADRCPAPYMASQLLRVVCVSGLPAHGYRELGVDTAGASHLAVYSVDIGSGGCQPITAYLDADHTLPDWERQVWRPGEPVAALAILNAGGLETRVTGIPAYRSVSPVRLPGPSVYGLPAQGPEMSGRIVSASPECQLTSLTYAAAAASGCPTTEETTLPLPPMGGRGWTAAEPSGVTLRSSADLSAIGSHRSAEGWSTYAAVGAGASANAALFPLAAGMFDGTQSTLSVTNMAITATSTVELAMTDGNGDLHKVYTDPEPLCAGGTRNYDIDALAGEIPPTGRGGLPRLSVAVTSLPETVGADAPPIAASIRLETPFGEAAYSGLQSDNPLAGLGLRDNAGTPVVVVPDIRFASGTSPHTTILVLSSVRSGGNPSRVYANFYDESGDLVVEGAYFRVRTGGGTIVDVSRGFESLFGDPLALPQGFHGTMVLRADNVRSPLAALAFNFPARSDAPAPPSGKDVIDVHLGAFAVQPPDPNAPTATPSPTRPVSTETAVATGTSGSPTATGTMEATSTPGAPGFRLYLPLALMP